MLLLAAIHLLSYLCITNFLQHAFQAKERRAAFPLKTSKSLPALYIACF